MKKQHPQWYTRKRTIFATLIFCGMCILYILIGGKDLEIYETIALGCFGLAGSSIGMFVGGQTWQSVNESKRKRENQ